MVRSVVVLAALALGAFAFPVSSALAAPINYVESIDGDLPFVNNLRTFTLGYGVHTVSGTMGVADAANLSTGIDWDPFAFIIPAGHQLTTASVALTDSVGNLDATNWNLRVGDTTFYGGTYVSNLVVNSPGVSSIDNLPLAAESYALIHASYSWPPGSSGEIRSNYTFTFTVVPEPASLSLLGLGALAILRRRRH